MTVEHPVRWIVGTAVALLTVLGGCSRYMVSRYDQWADAITTNRERIQMLEQRVDRLEQRVQHIDDRSLRRVGAEPADR